MQLQQWGRQYLDSWQLRFCKGNTRIRGSYAFLKVTLEFVAPERKKKKIIIFFFGNTFIRGTYVFCKVALGLLACKVIEMVF